MEGVRILAENAVIFTQHDFALNIFTVSFYILAVVLVMIMAWSMAYDKDGVATAAGIFATISLILGTYLANIAGTNEAFDYTEYKVIVDDTVNMNEFMSKYEILGRDGEIYIVREFAENE